MTSSDSESQLRTFVRDAKIHSYPQSAGTQTEASQFTITYSYENDEFHYSDIYVGDTVFQGLETVECSAAPLWAMSYRGGSTLPNLQHQIYVFLKSALAQAPADFPARGPAEFADGNFKYHNRWNGNFTNFTGEEQILLDDREVYSLQYFGGMVKSKQ